MPRVLAGPTTSNVSDSRYGKCYNILDNLADERYVVDAYARSMDTVPAPENVTVNTLGGKNRLAFYTRLYRTVARELRSGTPDIYHHMNLGYRWFNPLLLAGLQNDTPVVIGPCQAGHAILAEEFNIMLKHLLGTKLPRSTTDPLHSLIDTSRDVMLDPPRMELFERTLNAADRIVVVHDDAKDVYAESVDEAKLETIPLGVDPDDFTYSERPDNAELVAIGSLTERKGYDTLFGALTTIQGEFPDVHLHVFGEGPLETELRARVQRDGLADNVTFHGFVDQSVVTEHLSRAQAFVHPSRSESFSLVRLEAMSTGCPAIISDISGAREMVRDGEEGYVVPTEDADAVAEAVMTLLADHDHAKRIGRRARERVGEKYDWRDIGSQYLDVYESVLR